MSQRDRYQQFARTARELLADFRQVEENFRGLDRSLREQIAGWSGSKGALLDDGTNRDSITESDQGRSFQAFYDFLLSHHKQAELTELLERLQQIRSRESDGRLRGSTSTGSTPASVPRQLFVFSPTSSAASSTITCGSRIGGSSTCSAPSKARHCAFATNPIRWSQWSLTAPV